MPDLTTTHLKCLLDEATPGPWRISRTEGISGLGFAEDFYQDDPRKKANVTLAAAAPELAQEVINLRDALGYLVEETLLAAENSDDVVVQKRVADAIKTTVAKIQGDHDE